MDKLPILKLYRKEFETSPDQTLLECIAKFNQKFNCEPETLAMSRATASHFVTTHVKYQKYQKFDLYILRIKKNEILMMANKKAPDHSGA